MLSVIHTDLRWLSMYVYLLLETCCVVSHPSFVSRGIGGSVCILCHEIVYREYRTRSMIRTRTNVRHPAGSPETTTPAHCCKLNNRLFGVVTSCMFQLERLTCPQFEKHEFRRAALTSFAAQPQLRQNSTSRYALLGGER